MYLKYLIDDRDTRKKIVRFLNKIYVIPHINMFYFCYLYICRH